MDDVKQLHRIGTFLVGDNNDEIMDISK